MTSPKDSQLDLPPQVERWWIAFGPPQGEGWWLAFTRPGFGHCYAFRMPADQVILALNPCVHRIENGLRFERAYDIILRAKAAGERVLVYERPTRVYNPHTDVRVGRGLFVTCASTVAYLVGVNFSWRCTPWQLWQALIKAGAQEL